MPDLYGNSEASIIWAITRKGATSCGGGIKWGCDVFTDVMSGSIHRRSGCLVVHPDRLLEEADSSIQGLHQSQGCLCRSDLLLAISMALGCALDQSLDYWHPLVVSALPGRPDAWSRNCFLPMDRDTTA